MAAISRTWQFLQKKSLAVSEVLSPEAAAREQAWRDELQSKAPRA
jgi:hypothetical protein